MNNRYKRSIMVGALAAGFALVPVLDDAPTHAEVGTIAGTPHKPIKVRLQMPPMDAKKACTYLPPRAA